MSGDHSMLTANVKPNQFHGPYLAREKSGDLPPITAPENFCKSTKTDGLKGVLLYECL